MNVAIVIYVVLTRDRTDPIDSVSAIVTNIFAKIRTSLNNIISISLYEIISQATEKLFIITSSMTGWTNSYIITIAFVIEMTFIKKKYYDHPLKQLIDVIISIVIAFITILFLSHHGYIDCCHSEYKKLK